MKRAARIRAVTTCRLSDHQILETPTLAEATGRLDSLGVSHRWARTALPRWDAGTLESWDAGILGSWGPRRLHGRSHRHAGPRSPGFQCSRFPGSRPLPSARIDGGTLRDGIAYKQVSISSGVPASCPQPPVNVLHIRRRLWRAAKLMPGCIAECARSDDVGLRVRSPIASGNKVLCSVNTLRP